ncbi:MAG: hypothetical protein ACLSFT_08630 [Ruminococcus callidus]
MGGATVLVFDVTGFDPKNGKKTPQGKNKNLIDGIAKHGVVCEAVQRTRRCWQRNCRTCRKAWLYISQRECGRTGAALYGQYADSPQRTGKTLCLCR